MLLDSGMAIVKRGTNTASPGEMPDISYTTVFSSYYAEKTVGFSRFFTAKEHGSQADLMIQIQRRGDIKNSDIVQLIPFGDDGTYGKYNIIQIQHVVDQDGQKMTDLTLERIDGIDP